MFKWASAALLLAVILCSLMPAALGQVDYATATLKGTVFDPQELLVPNATVTIKNHATGYTKTVLTEADGSYQLPLLKPGTYRLEIQAQGFTPMTTTISVSVGQTAIFDAHLTVKMSAEMVEVSAEGAVVQVEQTQQANTLNLRQISELPNISRSFTDSVFTLPGVSKSEAPRAQNPGFSGFQSSGFSIGGSNGRNNLLTIDGGEADYGSGQPRMAHVPVDSIQEFQVNRSSFAAEFGFTTGTAVNLVTKSGTNAYHGSMYAYFHNRNTDAANYFAPKLPEKAFEQSFIPGATFGGPIVKNKLFMFVAFEYIKQDLPQFRSYLYDAGAQGIASNSAQLAYVNGMISSGNPMLAGLGAQLMHILTPSNFPVTNALLAPNTGVFNDWKKFHNLVSRFDYQVGPNDSIVGRFSFMRDNASRMSVLDPLNSPDDATIQYWDDYTLLGSWSHSFNQNVFNQMRIQVVPSDTADVRVASPNTANLRLGSLGNFRGEHYEPYFARQRRFQFENSTAWTRGKHTIKFGASYRPVSYLVNDKLWFGGQFDFFDGTVPITGGVIQPTNPAFPLLVAYNLGLGLPPTGNPATNLSAIQTFDLGIPVAFRQGFGNPQWTDWAHYFGFYGQDSWKLTQNLNMDIGARVDWAGEPAPLPHHTYVSPRLGIAWNPDGQGKTVIRLGGGLFVAPVNFFIDYIVNLLDDSGRYISQTANTLTSTPINSAQVWGYGLATGKLPFAQLTAADMTALGLKIGPGQPGRVVLEPSPNYQNPRSIQASLSVQRSLPSKMSVEVGYQMYRGLHLQMPRDGNVKEVPCSAAQPINPFSGPCYAQIDPTIVQREVYSSIGKSIYHGMTASLSRRSAALQFQVNYTFSKTIDDNTDFNNDFMPFRPTRLSMERSVSAFNIKHNFVASAVYALPFQGGGRRRWLSAILGDMTASPVLALRSGIPFTIRVPGMQNGTLQQSLYARPWHAGRNSGMGPNYYALDMRVTKSFYVRRDTGVKFDVLVEGTNILNRTNFSAVNDVFPADPTYALGSGTLLNGPYNVQGIRALDPSQPLGFKSAFDARQIQFGLKFVF